MESADLILIGAITNPASLPAVPSAEVLEQIEEHRLGPLAWDAVMTAGYAERWPEPLRGTLRRGAAAQALVSELANTELRRVVDALGEAGIRAVLIKGAALAFTHYRRPHLRPRTDTDLVIDGAQRDAVAEILMALGYARSPAVDGVLVTQQFQWSRTLRAGVVHALDVHWRVFNPHAFANVLSVERVLARAVPVPALGPHALAPCSIDALVLACAHRAAHHAGDTDALWDFDVHLLVSSLGGEEVRELQQAVAAADVRAIAAAGIASAASRFGTTVPPTLQAFLARAVDHREPTAVFLDAGRRQVDVLLSDVGALRGWRARALLIWQHLVPPPRYVLEKYGRRSRAWLPWLYLRRLFGGLPRWLRSQRS